MELTAKQAAEILGLNANDRTAARKMKALVDAGRIKTLNAQGDKKRWYMRFDQAEVKALRKELNGSGDPDVSRSKTKRVERTSVREGQGLDALLMLATYPHTTRLALLKLAQKFTEEQLELLLSI